MFIIAKQEHIYHRLKSREEFFGQRLSKSFFRTLHVIQLSIAIIPYCRITCILYVKQKLLLNSIALLI